MSMRNINKGFDDLLEAEKNLVPISMAELYSMEFPENQWAIEGLIPQESITILSGTSGSYKTWILLRMAIDISKGGLFLETFPCEQSNVLIIDEENHLRFLKNRLKLMGADQTPPIHFLSQKEFLVSNFEHVDKVLRICEEKSINTIFIDSLVRINRAEENDASQMSEVFRCIRQLCQGKKTVIITHHEKKEGVIKFSAQSRMRGSSDISAAVDAHIAIKRDKDNKHKIIFEQAKLRIEEEMEPFEVMFKKENGRVELSYQGAYSEDASKKESAKEAILSLLGEKENGLSRSEICKNIKALEDIGQKSTVGAIDELINEKLLFEKQGNRNTKICYLPKFQETSPYQDALV